MSIEKKGISVLGLMIFPLICYANIVQQEDRLPKANLKVMQSVTEERAHPWAGMTEAQAFASDPFKKCRAGYTDNHCFVQLTTSAVGAVTTQGANSCPDDYSPIIAFGNKVFVAGTNQVVVFTQPDVHNSVTEPEKNFYQGKGYTCGPGSTLVSERIETGDNENTIKTWIGKYRNINSKYLYLSTYRYWGRTCYGPAGAVLADWSCDNTTIGTGDWSYKYDLMGYRVNCNRNAGFWPPTPASPAHPMAAEGAQFTPTTVICAKSYIKWKEKP